jgi:hypothetical protein
LITRLPDIKSSTLPATKDPLLRLLATNILALAAKPCKHSDCVEKVIKRKRADFGRWLKYYPVPIEDSSRVSYPHEAD